MSLNPQLPVAKKCRTMPYLLIASEQRLQRAKEPAGTRVVCLPTGRASAVPDVPVGLPPDHELAAWW